MLIFIDARAPEMAKKNLAQWGDVIPFITQGICYDAISGHPDIFMFQHPEGLVVASNLPKQYFEILNRAKIQHSIGKKSVGYLYPETSYYNALWSSYGIIHNTHFTAHEVLSKANHTISCKQGYVRCNTVQIGKTLATSDPGIKKVFENKGIPHVFINPSVITLPGFKHGFFGGCCGIWNNKLFICGNPELLPDYVRLSELIQCKNFEMVALYQGPLIDIGGIFFIPF